MSSSQFYDVIILNYNSWQQVKELCKKIRDNKNLNKIFIVDNASSDDSLNQLAGICSDKVCLIQNKVNKGYAAGNNVGIRESLKEECAVGFICNPDVIVEEDIFDNITAFLNNNNEYALAACLRTDIDGKYNQRQYWHLPSYKDEILECFMLVGRKQKKKRVYYVDREQVGDVCDVDVLPGSFFGFYKENLSTIGLFDERTFLWYEENILAARLKNKYKSALLTTGIYIHNHKISSTTEKFSRLKRVKISIKSRTVYLKYYLKCSVLKMIFIRMCFVVETIECFLIDIINQFKRKK